MHGVPVGLTHLGAGFQGLKRAPIGPFGCSRLPDSDPTNAAWIGRGPVVTADGFEAMTVP
jgi:hypothetical protein